MPLDHAHLHYVTSHTVGRLATVSPNGTPQNKPVGYRYNARLGTIDIAGYDMEDSAKYRNIRVNPEVAFVIDDAVGEGPEGVRFLEVRGVAEPAVDSSFQVHGDSSHIIRIHPRRVVSWNIDPDSPGARTQNLAPAE
ncbi:PPOX class F420-dependent oxidoreductase [Flindersiella endophytica]